MTNTTIVKEQLTVKRMIPAAKAKFGKGAIIVTFNGKDEFINFNDGVNESDIQDGKTYLLELSISDKGKRYLNKVVKEVTHSEPVTSKKEVHSKTKKDMKAEVTDKVDWAAKDRAMAAGGILHDAAALVAANAGGLSHDEIVGMVRNMAVSLVDVKHAVEEELQK